MMTNKKPRKLNKCKRTPVYKYPTQKQQKNETEQVSKEEHREISLSGNDGDTQKQDNIEDENSPSQVVAAA